MQRSFSDLEYAAKKKATRRDQFLADVEAVTPWAALIAEVELFDAKGEGLGRPPIGVERMLHMHIIQQCFGLCDEGIEDAIYDSQVIRGFVGIDLSREGAPDATTLLKFRRLLEEHQLAGGIFATINAHLAENGLLLKEGTVADATIIAVPSLTKNQSEGRDPEMHLTKKDNEWHFGMKAHIDVDAGSELVHTLVTTAANVNDVTQAQKLLHGEEGAAFGDACYQGGEAEREPEQHGEVVCRHAAQQAKRLALHRATSTGRADRKAQGEHPRQGHASISLRQ